jgi:erythromycin esterase-like protein
MQTMRVPEAREGSIEEILHAEGAEDKILFFDPENTEERFLESYPHRAIGVVYHPDLERHGNYVPSEMARRYDAFIYIDETQALHPLNIQADTHEVPETYPFGL